VQVLLARGAKLVICVEVAGRKVVTESQRQRESCASLDLCGANAYCSISSPLIWSAEECGAEIVKYVPDRRVAPIILEISVHWARFARLGAGKT